MYGKIFHLYCYNKIFQKHLKKQLIQTQPFTNYTPESREADSFGANKMAVLEFWA